MVEVNDMNNIPEDIVNSDELFKKLARVLPPRSGVELPEEEGGGQPDNVKGALKKRMKDSPTLSDMQTADKRLFPPVIIDDEVIEWLSDIQVSRVFPEAYNPYRSLLAKDMMSEHSSMRLVPSFSIADRVLSTGIEGEGRIDELQLVGRAAALEKEKEAKLV